MRISGSWCNVAASHESLVPRDDLLFFVGRGGGDRFGGVGELGEFVVGEGGFFFGDFADGAVGFGGFFGDVGGFFVADDGGEGGGEHEAFFDEVGAAGGGLDAVDALGGEVFAGVGEEGDGFVE